MPSNNVGHLITKTITTLQHFVTHKLTVLEKRALKKVFGPRRKKCKGEQKKLHSEEIHDSHSSPNIIRMQNEGAHNGLDIRNMWGKDK
jgi:hypothetical protein